MFVIGGVELVVVRISCRVSGVLLLPAGRPPVPVRQLERAETFRRVVLPVFDHSAAIEHEGIQAGFAQFPGGPAPVAPEPITIASNSTLSETLALAEVARIFPSVVGVLMGGLLTGPESPELQEAVPQLRANTMNRRGFVAGALASGFGGVLPLRAQDNGGSGLSPGLQLYTIRSLMQDDVPSALALVAGVGYRHVEFAGYFGYPASELRLMLDDMGLAAPAVHISPADMAENLKPLSSRH